MKRTLQRGLTLVELMIAITLGMLVVLMATSLLVSANANYVHHAESARVQDGGRYALDLVARAVRQGAYLDWERDDAPIHAEAHETPSVAGLDAHSVGRGGDGIGAPLARAHNGSDVLAVRFAGAGAGREGDGSVLNCGGFGAAAGEDEADDAGSGRERARHWSIFYVAKDGAGEPELRCKYRGKSGWGADAIVRGVDSFQVLYGLDSDGDGAVNRYLTASALNALDAALVPDGADPAAQQRDRNRKSHWKRLVSVKVALLVHGERGSRPGSPPAVFDLFGRDYADGATGDPGVRIDERRLAPEMQGRARHVFTTTVVLHNHSARGGTP